MNNPTLVHKDSCVSQSLKPKDTKHQPLRRTKRTVTQTLVPKEEDFFPKSPTLTTIDVVVMNHVQIQATKTVDAFWPFGEPSANGP